MPPTVLPSRRYAAASDAGFDASVLCEFRARLLAHKAESLLFDSLLERCRDQGWLKVGGRQRTDSTHVLAAVRAINRVETVVDNLRHALKALATLALDWLCAHLPHLQQEWEKRYTGG